MRAPLDLPGGGSGALMKGGKGSLREGTAASHAAKAAGLVSVGTQPDRPQSRGARRSAAQRLNAASWSSGSSSRNNTPRCPNVRECHMKPPRRRARRLP